MTLRKLIKRVLGETDLKEMKEEQKSILPAVQLFEIKIFCVGKEPDYPFNEKMCIQKTIMQRLRIKLSQRFKK